MRMLVWVAMAVAGALAPASAQMASPGQESSPVDCTLARPASPAELATWSARTPLTAAGSASQLRGATLTPGQAVDAALIQTAAIRYVVRPEKPGGSVSYGGLFAFAVDTAGTYRIALGSGAWIDVLKDGKAVESAAHGHGPACTGIRKMVDFPLAPGRYVLQIAANGSAGLPLLVTRLP